MVLISEKGDFTLPCFNRSGTSVALRVIHQQLRNFLDQYHPLSDDEFSSLQKILLPLTLKKKEFLLRQGETEKYIYFLGKGLIHQYFFKGKEMISTDFQPENALTGGIVSFFSGEPSYYNLQAIEACSLLGLAKTDLERLYRANKKWEVVGRSLLTHYVLIQEKEIMDTIRLSMRERYVQFARKYPDLLKKLPQRRIASYLNIKPETFSRLKPLLKNG